MATTTSTSARCCSTRRSEGHSLARRGRPHALAPPVFLPPTSSTALWMLNLEELASCVPMVQAALYQLSLERKCGEYELPEGASIIACSNRENDRGIVHRMPTPLANRFVHLEIRVDARDWCAWGAANGIAPGSAVLHRAGAGDASPVSSGIEGARFPRAPAAGSLQATSSRTATASIPRSSGRCSGARWAKPRRWSSRRS